MKKLLIVCGPTATGKSLLALKLAKKFGGEVVSADSRQIYRGMDIGTGKELPVNSKLKIQNLKLGGYYKIDGVRIWGYDIADAKKGFSVAQYIKIAWEIIDNILARGKLPILVGGTGLYIKGVVDGIATAQVPPNLKLRKSLSEKNSEELFEILAQVDAMKAGSLNTSDRKNPRRLIRAIEVALNKSKIKVQKTLLKADTLFVGLYAPKAVIGKRINLRVDSRTDLGIEKEIKSLLSSGVKWGSQAMDSLGYRQWKKYFENPGKALLQETIKSWKSEEHSYAKRQMTWFKKDKRINWFDISTDSWEKNVEKLVEKWYSGENSKFQMPNSK